MGVIEGEVLSTQLSSSSSAHHYSGPEFGRLNIGLGYGAWCAAKQDKNQYLQVGKIWAYELAKVKQVLVLEIRDVALLWVILYPEGKC